VKRVTPTELMAIFARAPAKIEAAAKVGLTKGAVKVRDDAVKKFGEYQPAVGPYNAWELLAIQTVNRKMDYGGASGPDPLIGHYEKGMDRNSVWPAHLRNTIEWEISGLHAQVGTQDPIGLWQEFGTSRGVPPRPFLRPALWENMDYVNREIKVSIAEGLFSL